MADETTFNRRPRDFALELVEEGRVSAEDMLNWCLGFMSGDDVRGMLDANELSPRFEEEEEEESEEYCVECDCPLTEEDLADGGALFCLDCIAEHEEG